MLNSAMALALLSPQAFCDALREAGISRAHMVWNPAKGRLEASHALLEPLAHRLSQNRRDFDQHEGIFLQRAPQTGVLQGAFVHRTCRGQAAGGVRFWRYETVEDYLLDGLRLAQGMTLKNALAGIWWGGGKGVMAKGTGRSEDAEARQSIYEEYGSFMSALRGCYVTAEDAGTSVQDMEAVFKNTRFTTCIPESMGGSGNPSVPTARGILQGMEAALEHTGKGELEGKRIALQGLGHVGEPLIGFLLEAKVAQIVGVDVDPQLVERLNRRFSSAPVQLRAVSKDDVSIFSQPADILSPCAIGGILNGQTAPMIQAPIVCGAANNQLEDPEVDDQRLAERGITYVPDFLVNRMGIVTCADEGVGYLPRDPAIETHLSREWDHGIFRLTLRVLADAQTQARTPHQVAIALARELAKERHPIWGHRGAQIIRGLTTSKWFEAR